MDIDQIGEDEQLFQKPNKYLKFLPVQQLEYVNDDADFFLSHVKSQLSASVLQSDIKQGANFWTDQLMRYIKTYELRFTKQDHISFVKLMFELTVTPEQEISVTNTFAKAFDRLVKTKRLLNPDELCLPWRPVYRLWKSVMDCKNVSYGQRFLPSYAETMVTQFAQGARVYFPIEATQEMLDEWKPMHCPFDTAMIDAFELYSLFLPTSGHTQQSDKTYKLWFNDFMSLYTNLDGSSVGWEAKLVSLFSRTAGHNIGLIDWEPHVPHIFSRILKSFGLPVGPTKYQLSHADSTYDYTSACLWVVAMISPNNSVMKHISQLINTVEPFMHPSNYGWWQKSLSQTIAKLCSMFVARLHVERYKRPCWYNYIPDDQKLTDKQITEFVEIMKPIVLTGLFGKQGPQEMTSSLYYLAFLRPELMIPPHLENLYPALENLTEPHRLQATLSGTIGIARALLSSQKWYPEGRLHVIRIMLLCLPGIDSNDSKKTMITLQLISTLATLVPLVDCSDASQVRSDLNEIELELCAQTAQLQDFIFIFIDRVISLIEGLSLDHHESAAAREKASSIEAMVEAVLRTATISVFQQTSPALFKLAFEKVWNYISSSVFEVLVAGRLASSLMYGIMRPCADVTVPVVIPFCCQKILELTDGKDVVHDVRADNSLLWYMLLLSECLRIDGGPLVPYYKDIEAVLDRTVHMTNNTAHTTACNILERFLKSVGSIFPTDFCSVSTKLDSPLTEYLPIRDWGRSCNLKDLEVKWHLPGPDALSVIESIFRKFVMKELLYLDGSADYDREQLQRSLRIIIECIKGAGLYLPPLDSEPYEIENECFMDRVRCTVRGPLPHNTILLDGVNARNRILQTVRPLMEKLLNTEKDSAKPLSYIASIYRYLLLYFGIEGDVLSSRAQSVKSMQKALENPLMPGQSRVRMIHVEQCYIQQCRIIMKQARLDPFTQQHYLIYHDLLKLATSRYDDVQSTARIVLSKSFSDYKYSYRVLIPEVCRLLETPPPAVTEEEFKGALGLVFNLEWSFIKGSCANQSLAIVRDPLVLRQIWPSVIKAQHSEKPSIQILVDKIMKRIEQNYETSAFSFPVTDNSIAAAEALRKLCKNVVELDLSLGKRSAMLRTEKYKNLYQELVNDLLQLVNSDSLQWKHQEFALEMLAFLQRHDKRTSLEEIKLFTKNLVNDSVSVRKLSIGTVTGMMYSLKKRYPPTFVPCERFSGYEDLQYDIANVPDTEKKWAESVFVEKTHWGCTSFPKQFPVSVGFLEASPPALDEVQQHTLEAFSNEDFTYKLFKYLSIESKEKDSFSSRNYTLFKVLTRCYGPPIIEFCKSSVMKLLADKDHHTELGRQRCVAEFVAGVVRGCKFFTFGQMNEMFDWLIPMLKKATSNVSDDSVQHWGTAFATCGENREPKKLYRLFQYLLEEVQAITNNSDSSTSLATSAKLYFLQGILGQQEWRVPGINCLLAELVKKLLACPFKNIRSRLGSVLCSCFICDVPFSNADCWHNPKRSDMVQYCLPLVKELEDSEDSELTAAVEETSISMETADDPDSLIDKGNTEPIKNGLHTRNNSTSLNRSKLIFKTVLSWLHANFDRHVMYQKWTKEILQFIPVICPHTANFSDPELRQLCQTVVKHMSKSLLPSHLVTDFIHVTQEAIGLSSWHARLTVLEMLQSMMFLNQFTLAEHVMELQEMVIHLLSDEQYEVKLMAATTLSGGIQCKLFDVEKSKLINHFKRLTHEGYRKKNVQKSLVGLLGLGAIVQAYPYEVPGFLPEVLMILSDHVHDPQPIQKTVKDVLSEFKRTHHDNWVDHKQKFTDDQLAVLTDLLVSPNYYA